MPRAGFEPTPADDTSYEADALPTKPPRLVAYYNVCYVLNKIGYKKDASEMVPKLKKE